MHPNFGDDTDKAVSESINYLKTLKEHDNYLFNHKSIGLFASVV